LKALNLASQPFESERLPGLVTGVALAIMLVVSALHVDRIRELSASRVDRGELVEGERELRELYSREHRARPQPPAPEDILRWATLKELIDRRTFSWGALLSDLESLLPRDVRLVSISPSLDEGVTELQLRAMARSRTEGYEFVRVLQESGRFSRAIPLSVATAPVGEDFVYRMRYDTESPRREEEAP
jgi:hypothetical protein